MPLTAKLIRRTAATASRSVSRYYNIPYRTTGITISRTVMSSSAFTDTDTASASASSRNQSTSSPSPVPSSSNPTPHSSDPNHAVPPQKPLLPALDSVPATQEQISTNTVQVNGAPVVLDKLGPMVVGRDGTLSRIANWHEMSEFERQNTLRILGKRNQLRLKSLRQGLDADGKNEEQEE